MHTPHHDSISQRITSLTQRVFNLRSKRSMLAAPGIDARTARDIGINLVGLH